MPKIGYALALLALLCANGWSAAVQTSQRVRFVSLDPSGSCGASYITQNLKTGKMRGCVNGSWADLGAPASVACAAAPGNTTGVYRQLCQATATGAVWVCNNSSGCAVAADWAAVGSTSRTWNYSFQGTNYGGVAAFGGNIPAATAPTAKLNATGDLGVLDFPTTQSTYYWYGSWRMPPGYPANGAISYTISSMCDPANCDSTHAANVYISLACSGTTARPDSPSYTEIAAPVAITNGALGVQTVTSGTIMPNAGGLPACATTNRATVKLRVDTNTNSLTGSFQLVAVSIYVQGSI